MSIASQLYILGYCYDILGRYGVEVWLYLLFFFVFLLSLCHGLLEPTHYNIAAFPLLSHHLLLLVDTLLLSISLISVSFSATWVSTVSTFVLINLWTLGSSPPEHYHCFIHINFIFFSIPADMLSLQQCFLLHPVVLMDLWSLGSSYIKSAHSIFISFVLVLHAGFME